MSVDPPMEPSHRPKAPIDALLARPFVRLELGCGGSKRDANAIGIDVLDRPGVDLVADAATALGLFPTASVDEIYSEHFLEHIDDPRGLLTESARVLRPGGTFRAVVPHFSNPWFYSDPTHRSFYGLYTFSYWVNDRRFKRGVPKYATPLPFDLVTARHIFKSSRPFVGRHGLKKATSAWVNLTAWTQEFYEEVLSPIFPCYEIDFTLKRHLGST